jgi:hypothetical protein
VFNCGGETRYSQDDEVYKLRSLNLSLTVGREAAKRGVKCFVELSTGMVYKPDSAPSKENDKLKPWSKIAVFKLQAEEELAKIEGCVFSLSPTYRVPLACRADPLPAGSTSPSCGCRTSTGRTRRSGWRRRCAWRACTRRSSRR